MRLEQEPLTRWCREAVEAGLFEAHWREVESDLDRFPLEPDFEKFFALERAGVLVSFTAREERGGLAGYAIYFASPPLHHKSSVFAYCDSVYLAPEQRRGRAGIDLLRVAERVLVARGVAKIVYPVKLHHDWGPVLERLGYAAAEQLYAKVVG